jgi:hypothetical protein
LNGASGGRGNAFLPLPPMAADQDCLGWSGLLVRKKPAVKGESSGSRWTSVGAGNRFALDGAAGEPSGAIDRAREALHHESVKDRWGKAEQAEQVTARVLLHVAVRSVHHGRCP